MTQKAIRHHFVIDRKRWARGKRAEGTTLLNEDGTMCCLGFFLKSCGVKKIDLLEVAIPSAVDAPIPENAAFLVSGDRDSRLCSKLIQANDAYLDEPLGVKDVTVVASEEAREERLKELFASKGVEVSFRGKRK